MAVINRSAFNELVTEVSKEATDIKGSQLLDNMQRECPVITGQLRDSLRMETDAEGVAYVGSDLDYSLFVEQGTRKKAPNAFMRRALDTLSRESDVIS